MNLVKEAAWTVSNVTAGNPDQIQMVIDAGLISPLVEVLVKVSIASRVRRAGSSRSCFL